VAWDDNKDPEDLIRSSEWDTMVSDQKGHSSRHESGGLDEIDHDLLLNYVSNEHINHSTISILAGTHLTGGGDLTSSRTLNVDETGIDAANLSGSSGTNGQVLQTDGSNADWVDLQSGEAFSFVTGMTQWADGLSNEEIEQLVLQSGESLIMAERRRHILKLQCPCTGCNSRFYGRQSKPRRHY